MLAGYIAYVSHVHDAPLVSNHANSDGVFTHFRCDVLVDLDAQIFQHQQPWTEPEQTITSFEIPET